MTTLKLDNKKPYSPTSPRTEKIAKALDADRNSEVTLAEVKAGTTEQQHELFKSMAFDEFMPKLDRWQAHPLKAFANKLFGGDSQRKDFLRTGEVGNVVGNLVNERISAVPGQGVSVGYDQNAVEGANPDPRVEIYK